MMDESSVGMMKFPSEWKTKIHVPNHQPVDIDSTKLCQVSSLSPDLKIVEPWNGLLLTPKVITFSCQVGSIYYPFKWNKSYNLTASFKVPPA